MKLASFTKKPVTIEAAQFTKGEAPSLGYEIAKWCGGRFNTDVKPSDHTDVRYSISIPTLEGVMTADEGDYIIKGIQGEFYPCKPDIFEATYSKQEASPVELGGVLFDQEQFAVVTKMCEDLAIPLRLGSDEATLIEQASVGLQYLLGLQHTVETGWNRLPDQGDPEWQSQYIREVVLCATDELHELLAEVHWKPWKNKSGIKDLAKYREELADVLHFVLDLYLAAGLSGEDMVTDYVSKNEENISRLTRTEYLES